MIFEKIIEIEKYYDWESIFRGSLKKELGYNADDFLILCTGELNVNKNQKELIKAMSLIEQTDIKVILAGNGPNADVLMALIKEYGLGKRVDMVGYRTDLCRFVKASDAVVSMSIREGLPLNVVEAMLCGKPVIVTNNRGHRELVRDGVNGLFVETHNSELLMKKIMMLYENSALRVSMGKKGYEIAQNFTVKKVIKEIEKIYFE